MILHNFLSVLMPFYSYYFTYVKNGKSGSGDGKLLPYNNPYHKLIL